MKIVHLCLCCEWDERLAYQDQLLPHYHRLLGHDVTIITNTYYRETPNSPIISTKKGTKLLADGSKLIKINPIIKNYTINSHLHVYESIKKVLADENPDFIFGHNVSTFNYLCLLDIKKSKPSVNIVFDNHADWINSYHSLFSKGWAFLNKIFICNKLQRISNTFYGVTPSRCDFLEKIYGIKKKNVKLLYMGADDNEMQFSKKDQIREEVRNNLKIKKNEFLIVSGGRIDIKKNIHKIAEAVQRLDRNVKLLVFGSVSPDLQSVFESFDKSKIISIGWIPSKDVYKYFYAADFVMFPGLHSVLWEQALACRVPCAFSHLDGFDHVNYNNNCVFLEDTSVEYYKNVINNIISNKYLYNSLVKQSNTALADQFKYSYIAKKSLEYQ